jgi:hypothetical protein
MNIQQKIDSLVALGNYLLTPSSTLEQAIQQAYIHNGWFTPSNTAMAINNIATQFLTNNTLQQFVSTYPPKKESHKKVGLVMAGNIPLVGFHDLLCILLSNNIAVVKLSSKDEVLMKHVINWLFTHNQEWQNYIIISEMLKGCDAYIATGSNNSALHFEAYFGKYKSIIRKNRTSVAILTGEETNEELEKLADDVCQFFGLGCRNVTHIYVPQGYNFEKLLPAFNKYKHLADHNKYKNNYDYNLALYLLNNAYYMTNEQILLVENPSHFAPISCLHYSYYTAQDTLLQSLSNATDIQCIVHKQGIGFGQAQCPSITNFADGVDTMQFLVEL